MAVRNFLSMFVTVEGQPEAEPVVETLSSTAPDKTMPQQYSYHEAPDPVTPVAQASRTAMDWTLDEVLKAGGTEIGRNSADTVIKLRESLAAFPEAQQVAMVRAMDAADETWSEDAIKLDAQRRIGVLEKYTTLVGQDEAAQVQRITAGFQAAKQANDARVSELEAQIAALQAEREKTMQSTAAAQAAADEQAKAVKVRADGVRSTVTAAIAKYKGLLGFFGV